jgi:hypothetical protein
VGVAGLSDRDELFHLRPDALTGLARDEGDNTSRELFERLLCDEEGHVDWLEAQAQPHTEWMAKAQLAPSIFDGLSLYLVNHQDLHRPFHRFQLQPKLRFERIEQRDRSAWVR